MPPQKPSGWIVDDIPDAAGDPSAGGGWSVEGIPDAPKDSRSAFARVWDAATTPLVGDETARKISGAIAGREAAPMTGGFFDALKGIPDVVRAFVSDPVQTARSFAGGAVEGAANLTSPVDLALLAAGPAGRAARTTFTPAVQAMRELEQAITAARGMGRLDEVARLGRELASMRQTAGRAQAASGVLRGGELGASGGMVARGVERAVDAEHEGDMPAGVAQTAFGLLGLRMTPPAVGRIRLAPQARLTGQVDPSFRVTPEGVAGRPGEIPLVQSRDGSFVQAIPGQYARREIRGLLPEAPYRGTPEGAVIPPGRDVPAPASARAAGDPSSVRAVPGQFAQREVKGLLPAARGYVADRSGNVVRVEDAGKLGTATPRELPGDSFVRAERGAFGTTINDRDSIGEPEIAALTEYIAELRRPLFKYDRKGRLHDAIAGERAAKVSRPTVATALQEFLETGKRSAFSDAALRLVRTGGLPNPELSLTSAARSVDANRPAPPDSGWRGGRQNYQGGARAADEDAGFDAFSKAVDDLAAEGPSVGREPGEEGAINPALLLDLGGAATGAVAGGAVGDDMDARVRNAALGAAAGLAGRSTVQAFRPRPLARFRFAGDVAAEQLDSRVSGMSPMRDVQTPALDDAGRLVADAGAASPQLLASMGGGVAGATAGAATGDDTESRIRGGVIGGLAGVLAPSMLRRQPGGATVGVLRAAQPTVGRIVAKDAIPTTARPAPKPSTPMRDPMAGVETFLEKMPEEVRGGIRQVLEDNSAFAAQRRGVVNQEAADRLADNVLVDLQRRVKPGTALNVEAIRAHTDALATAQAKVNDLSQRMTRGQNTDADVLGLEAAKAEVKTLAASIMGARSEAGRALAQFKMLARVLETGNPRLIAEAAQGLRGDAAQFAAAFSQLPDDPVSRFRWLQQQGKPGIREQARQYYYSSILSGIKTHERNVGGNLANVLTNLLTHPAAAGIDVVKSTVKGTPRQVLFSELKPQMVGAFMGLQRGFHEALFSLRHGVNRSALTQSLSAAEAGKLDVPRVEFGGGGANPINWPGRALDAADQFFRSIARNQEAYGLAFTQARREGRTGQALIDRMADLRAGIGEDGQRLLEQADMFARRSVFQEKAGPIVGKLQGLVKDVPELTFVAPFIRTPANILRQGFEFSPAGFAMKAARQEGRAGTQAQARAALGSVALGGLAYLLATDQIEVSGSGPSNPADRAQLMESGWRPNSVRVGDRWVEISLFQPISVPLMVMANAFETWRASGAKDEDTASKIAATALKSVRSTLDLSFLSGVADLFAAIEDSGVSIEGATRVAGRIGQGFIPFVGAQRTVAQAIDPTVRKPRGFLETLQASVPGLTSSLEPRLDRFGNEVQRPGGALKRAADPFNVSPVVNDPVLAELGRLGLRMGQQTARMTLPENATLTRDQDFSVRQLKGNIVYTVLSRLMAAPGYQAASDAEKADALERAIEQVRSAVTSATKQELAGAR